MKTAGTPPRKPKTGPKNAKSKEKAKSLVKAAAPAVRAARRVRMLGRKLAGATTGEIAREEGICREWVRRELAIAPCRQIVVDLVNAELDVVVRVFRKSVLAIEDALGANATVQYQGQLVTLGVDHYARLTAAKRLLELLAAGRPSVKPAEETKREAGVTLQELEAMLKNEAIQ